jgi:hypothetical protein
MRFGSLGLGEGGTGSGKAAEVSKDLKDTGHYGFPGDRLVFASWTLNSTHMTSYRVSRVSVRVSVPHVWVNVWASFNSQTGVGLGPYKHEK